MLWPLAFKPVRQQHNQPTHLFPFGLGTGNKLIDNHLRAIGKIAKLRFPYRQFFGVGITHAKFKAQHRQFRQHGIIDPESALISR